MEQRTANSETFLFEKIKGEKQQATFEFLKSKFLNNGWRAKTLTWTFCAGNNDTPTIMLPHTPYGRERTHYTTMWTLRQPQRLVPVWEVL
jgi:hypothetical protein